MNVIGEPIDERGPIGVTDTNPIHADAPLFVDQSTETSILVTGIKVIDLLAPYAKGGKIGLFGGAGVGTRSEEHTSELKSLMRNTYAVSCLKKQTSIQHRVDRYSSISPTHSNIQDIK